MKASGLVGTYGAWEQQIVLLLTGGVMWAGISALRHGRRGVTGEDYEMTLKDEWEQLDSETRQWFLDNPGCVLVPRSITARVHQNSTGDVEVDGHGQMILSRADLDFIRAKGAGLGTGRVGEEFRFFDATQP